MGRLATLESTAPVGAALTATRLVYSSGTVR
jgi:hypothetical protein